ncbi:hypothetical protein [Arthrobacter agilis]|uniref:hypothetical protein n=1 Tax=Arthrobacter agilis TaxID=37921 RepID=UPI0027D87061|nr:hypothetical protein [Arthrobacter agilis]
MPSVPVTASVSPSDSPRRPADAAAMVTGTTPSLPLSLSLSLSLSPSLSPGTPACRPTAVTRRPAGRFTAEPPEARTSTAALADHSRTERAGDRCWSVGAAGSR